MTPRDFASGWNPCGGNYKNPMVHSYSFILMLFLPLTDCVRSYSNYTIRKIKVVLVMCIMFRDKWIIRFFKFPFCGDFRLHLHKLVEEISRNITRAENFRRHVFWNSLMLADINSHRCSTWAINKQNLWAKYFTSWRHCGWRLDCKLSYSLKRTTQLPTNVRWILMYERPWARDVTTLPY